MREQTGTWGGGEGELGSLGTGPISSSCGWGQAILWTSAWSLCGGAAGPFWLSGYHVRDASRITVLHGTHGPFIVTFGWQGYSHHFRISLPRNLLNPLQ